MVRKRPLAGVQPFPLTIDRTRLPRLERAAAVFIFFLALTLVQSIDLSAQPSGVQPLAPMQELELLAGFAILDEDHPALEAIADRGLAIDPGHARMIDFKIKALRGQGREEAAIHFIRGLWARDSKRFAYLRFEAGYIRSHQKLYDKAIINFRAAEEVDRPRAVREQVYVYQAQGDPARALAALERLDRPTAESLQLKGQVLMEAKQFDQARQTWQEALSANPAPEQAQALQDLLANLKAVERAQRPWRAHATVMAQYEDNVFRDPLQANPSQAPTRKKGDMSWLTKLDLDYALGRDGHTAWGFTSQAQTLQYANLRDANYASFSLGAYWEHQTPEWGIRIPYDYAYYWAKAALIRKVAINSLTPWLRLQHGQQTRTDVFGLLQVKNYRETDPNVLAWRLGLVHYLSEDPSLRRHLRLGYAASQDIASDDKSGYMTGEVSLGAATPLGGPFSLDLSVSYVRYWYDNRVDPFLPRGGEVSRRDDQYRAAAQIFFRPGDRWQLALGYFHTSNDSGLMDTTGFEPYDFRRNVVSLMLNWAF